MNAHQSLPNQQRWRVFPVHGWSDSLYCWLRRTFLLRAVAGLVALSCLAMGRMPAAEPAPAPVPMPDVMPEPKPAPAPGPEPVPAPAADEPADLEPDTAVIVVQGYRRRLVTSPDNPTRFVTQVDLSQATESLSSVADELEKTVGVTVRRLGGLGSFSTVSIRGSTAQQVEIFWDGIPLNRAESGLTNLEDIPLDVIERMEIYRGAAPAQFGAAGIGGVINLVPRRADRTAPGGVLHGLLAVSGGSWETWKVDAMVNGPAGDNDILAFYHRLQSRGDFEYENDNGTPLNSTDDRTEKRVNNEFVAQDFFLRVAAPLPHDWRWSVLADGFDKRQGLPGLDAVQARHARLRTGRGLLGVRVEAPPTRAEGAGVAELPATAFGFDAVYEEVQLSDRQSELSLSPTDDLSVIWTAGLNARAGWVLWPERLTVTAFGEARHEEAVTIYHLPNISHSPFQRRDGLTGVAQAELQFDAGRLRLTPTVRGQWLRNRLAGDPKILTPGQQGENRSLQAFLNPALGALWTPWPVLEFKANIGRFHRLPTFSELFGNRGGVVGSPNLTPERSLTFDMGFHAQPPVPTAWGRWEMEYAFFYLQTDDLIALVRNSQNTSKATNIGAARNLGHEFTLHWDTAEGWGGLWPQLLFNYTRQDPRDDSDIVFLRGNYLPNQPVDAWFLRVELGWEAAAESSATGVARNRQAPPHAAPPPWRLTGWVECAYTGETFHDRANLYLVDARTLVNAGLKWNWMLADQRAVTVGVEIKNCFDDRVTDVARYPLPGRSWFGTAQFSF